MEPICELCGKPITEDEAEAGDYLDTSMGEYHESCYAEAIEDIAGQTADFWYDYRYDR